MGEAEQEIRKPVAGGRESKLKDPPELNWSCWHLCVYM